MTTPIFCINIGSMNPNNLYIKREIEPVIRSGMNKGKVIILYGARRTGKTTLIKHLFEQDHQKYLYLSCEQSRIREQIVPDELALKTIIGDYKNIVFDEAQYLENPGLVLKVLIDSFPALNIIASGSSSFELAGKIAEPLTGRHFQYFLFPLSWKEIFLLSSPLNMSFLLEQNFRFGSYPEIFQHTDEEKKINYLQLLTEDYLYKDILAFNKVKQSRKLRELLVALSLQVGSEVSYSELANTISIDRKTVEYFIDLLEKTFVIFRLYGFSRNLRSEINRKVKIYFYDLGVRNALINNFNTLNLRSDQGALFENFVIAEMVKRNNNKLYKSNFYFWRTYDQKEIDLIEEKNGKLFGYECKYSDSKGISKTTRSAFQKAYPESSIEIISPKDYINYSRFKKPQKPLQ